MKKFLVIQTAFIGDVVLATGVLEKLHKFYPNDQIDLLVRKGNEGLLEEHPFVQNLLVWNKAQDKYKNLFAVLSQIRKQKYDAVFNLQRFAASGFLTAFSGAKYTAGFDKNPFSFTYNFKVKHEIGNDLHEIERNQMVIAPMTTQTKATPRLYPTEKDFAQTAKYKSNDYVVLAPTSVWFTKQLPVEKWVELSKSLNPKFKIYLIGGPGDRKACQKLMDLIGGNRVENLAGELSFLQSAALMKDAQMNYVNDSAPLHIAGSVQAPVTVFFCSTIPEFGFGPMLPNGKIAETKEKLNCRPCGLHGQKACPEGHFNCAKTINMKSFAI